MNISDELIIDEIINKGAIQEAEWPDINIREIAESILKVAKEIFPEIRKGLDESGKHRILFGEIVRRYKNTTKEYFSIESIFCGLSIALWHDYISIDIVLDNRYSIIFSFWSPYPPEEEPNTKNCAQIWKDLYETLLSIE